jgi:hypothetical protein
MSLRHASFAAILASASLLAACGGHDGGGAPPVAPGGLTAEPLAGGAHLAWTDNSDDEEMFMIYRMADGDAGYTLVDDVPFDTTTFHDTGVTGGVTYMFKVSAMNGGGETDSNEVEFVAP